jgi:hypothetical protein
MNETARQETGTPGFIDRAKQGEIFCAKYEVP